MTWRIDDVDCGHSEERPAIGCCDPWHLRVRDAQLKVIAAARAWVEVEIGCGDEEVTLALCMALDELDLAEAHEQLIEAAIALVQP